MPTSTPRAGLRRSRTFFVAHSNPCFELWLFLHFGAQTAHLNTAQIGRLLRKHLPRYVKHVRFEDVEHGYESAVSRARALERMHEARDSAGGNPSTGMHHLTERIRGLGKDGRL